MELTEQKLKAILREHKDEFKNYHGMLAEDFSDQVKSVAERVSDLGTKVDGLGNKFDHMSNRIDYIAELVARNTEDIEIIKSDTEFIKHGLKRKIDIEEFMALEKRVLKLEKAVARN